MRLLTLAAAAAIAFAAPASAQTYNITLAGASPGGLWSSLGAGIDAAVKAAYPGSTVTYQTSGGGIANVALVSQDRAELGIVHDAELELATNGEPPFKEPVKNLRAIAYLYTWAPVHILMRKSYAEEHGIKTFSDIAEKKPAITVLVNRRGNIAEAVAADMFKAIGVTYEDIEKWGGKVIYAASGEQADLMRDRRGDLLVNSLFVKQGSLIELGGAVDLVTLPMSPEVAEKAAKLAGADTFVIPGGAYDWQPEDKLTITLGAALVANEDMSDEDAYNLAKALIENVDQIRQVHPAMRQLTPELMAKVQVIDYHPGAAKAYREAGLMK